MKVDVKPGGEQTFDGFGKSDVFLAKFLILRKPISKRCKEYVRVTCSKSQSTDSGVAGMALYFFASVLIVARLGAALQDGRDGPEKHGGRAEYTSLILFRQSPRRHEVYEGKHLVSHV